MALADNKVKIQALLAGINALPEAGSGEAPDPVLQEKSVTPTKAAQSVVPDTGYDGLSKVNIGAIPAEYIIPSGTVSITQNGTHNVREAESVNVNVPAPEFKVQEKTVTPTTSKQTVTPDSGYDGLSQVTVKGDANLVAGNIKSGVSIFGVVGTLEAGSGGGGNTGGTCTVEIQGFNIGSMICDFFVYNNGESWIQGWQPDEGTYTVLAGTVMLMSAYNGFGMPITFETTGQVEIEHNEDMMLQVFKVNGDGAIIINS